MNPRRVLLKLSGEALAGPNKTGFDEATVKEVARQCNRPHQGRSDRNAGHGYELYLCF